MKKKSQPKIIQDKIGEEGIDQMLNIVNVVSVWSNGTTIRRYAGQDKNSVKAGYRKMVAILVEVKEDESQVECNDTPVEKDDDYAVIECRECGEEKAVEKGTWALDKGMCEPCYCSCQGG